MTQGKKHGHKQCDCTNLFHKVYNDIKTILKRLKRLENRCKVYEDVFKTNDWVLINGMSTLTIPYDTHCIKRSGHRLPYEVQVYVIDNDSIDKVSIATETIRSSGDVVIKTVGAPFKGVISISL